MSSWWNQVIDELRIFTWGKRLETFVSSVAAQNWKEPDRKSEVGQFGVWSHLRRFKTVKKTGFSQDVYPRGGVPWRVPALHWDRVRGRILEDVCSVKGLWDARGRNFRSGLGRLAGVIYVASLCALHRRFQMCFLYSTHAAPLAYVVAAWNTFKTSSFIVVLVALEHHDNVTPCLAGNSMSEGGNPQRTVLPYLHLMNSPWKEISTL